MAKTNRKGGIQEVPGVGSEETESVFLGTLRSEFDTEEELHSTWNALASAAEGVRLAYVRNEITPEEAAGALSKLRLEDRNGGEWTVGATSGEWYRRTNSAGQWLRTPPPALVLPSETAERWLSEGAAALLPVKAEVETESSPGLPSEFLPQKQEETTWAEPDDFEAFLATEKEEESFSAPVSAPVARANSVAESDLLGWAPARRSDGPELPEVAPLTVEDELSGLEELGDDSSDAPVDLGYGRLVAEFESGISTSDEPDKSEEPDVPSDKEIRDDQDDFDLPDDLFYRP